MRVARGVAGKLGSRSSANSTRTPIVPITRKAASSDSPAPSLSIGIQLELVAPVSLFSVVQVGHHFASDVTDELNLRPQPIRAVVVFGRAGINPRRHRGQF
jgi:hypothetical protein